MYNKVKKGMSMLFVACIVSSNFYTAPLLSFAQETQEDLSGQQSILSEQAPDGQEIVKQEMLAGQGNEEGKEPVTEPEGIGAFLSDLMKALRHTVLGGEKASQIKDRIIFEDIKLEQDGLDEHKKWAIKILLSSDAAGEGIYQIRELIQKIEIDDLDYPLFSTRGGTKGKRNFVAFKGSLRTEGNHGVRPAAFEVTDQSGAGRQEGEGLTGAAQLVEPNPRREARAERAPSVQHGAGDAHPPLRQAVGQVDDDALDAADLQVGAEKNDPLRFRRVLTGVSHAAASSR